MTRRNATARRQLDARIERLRPFASDARPNRGWIRAVREALGMSTTELAARMGVGQSRIPALEKGEVSGSIKLDSLHRAADALDCELLYALVPRRPLVEAVHAQARRKAARHLEPVGHHMLLEDQGVTDEDLDAQLDELALRFVDHRGLWAEHPVARG